MKAVNPDLDIVFIYNATNATKCVHKGVVFATNYQGEVNWFSHRKGAQFCGKRTCNAYNNELANSPGNWTFEAYRSNSVQQIKIGALKSHVQDIVDSLKELGLEHLIQDVIYYVPNWFFQLSGSPDL